VVQHIFKGCINDRKEIFETLSCLYTGFVQNLLKTYNIAFTPIDENPDEIVVLVQKENGRITVGGSRNKKTQIPGKEIIVEHYFLSGELE